VCATKIIIITTTTTTTIPWKVERQHEMNSEGV